MDIQGQSAQLDGSSCKQRETKDSDSEECDARIEEQPAGAVHEQKLEMAPAVSPCAQMRPARTTIGAERGRHLADAEPCQRRGHHHLAGIFHARRLEREVFDRLASVAAQAAVEIMHTGLEECASEEG